MNALLDLKPTDKVLFLAEGNFTFSLSLVEFWSNSCQFKLPEIVSTCFEPKPVSEVAGSNVQKLKDLGVRVLFSADATKWFVLFDLTFQFHFPTF